MDVSKTLTEINKNLVLDYAFCKGMESRCNFKYKNIYETSIYVLITQNDLIISSNNLHKNISESENKFYSRILALTIYEYFNDIHALLGKNLTKELSINNFTDYISMFNKVGKEITSLKKSHKNIKTIRHNTIAHKNRNKIELLESIFKIDDSQVLDLATDVININTKLVKLFTKIQNDISNYHKTNGQLENLCN